MTLMLVKLLIKVALHILLSDSDVTCDMVKDDSGADILEGGIDLLI